MRAGLGVSTAGWQRESADEKKEAENRELAKISALGRNENKGKELVNPLHLLSEAEKVMSASVGRKSIIVADGGDFCGHGVVHFATAGAIDLARSRRIRHAWRWRRLCPRCQALQP